jgi:uncharacterized protein (UPF0335 family)
LKEVVGLGSRGRKLKALRAKTKNKKKDEQKRKLRRNTLFDLAPHL